MTQERKKPYVIITCLCTDKTICTEKPQQITIRNQKILKFLRRHNMIIQIQYCDMPHYDENKTDKFINICSVKDKEIMRMVQ